MQNNATFRLSDDFISQYHPSKVTPSFGFNGFGALVYYRTYSRIKEDGTNEQWFETIRRVVEGCYRMQERHIKANDLGWSHARATRSAQEMYDRMFWMKFLPPGRGLWAMGSVLTESNDLAISLFNCAFVSTEDIKKTPTKPFAFLMDLSMLGVGVGFDVLGVKAFNIQRPFSNTLPHTYGGLYPTLPKVLSTTDYLGNSVTFNYQFCGDEGVFTIPDTREGWVLSIHYLLSAFFEGKALPLFDYSQIRPEGLLIKGFGGKSSGAEPLKLLHQGLITHLEKYVGQPISADNIVTINNMIGCCVVAGNVRRSSELVIGDPEDDEYLNLKDYWWDATANQYVGSRADRSSYAWASNNAVSAKVGMDYTKTGSQAGVNGEPGFVYLENMRNYGRMNGIIDTTDKSVKGTNPCGEIQLNSYECCNLVEIFPSKHETLEDFQRTLKYAYLYAKTITLSKTHWSELNQVMLKNRRIGCSQSGIMEAVKKLGIEQYRQWCIKGYESIQKWDQIYSDWLVIPRSIRLSTVKPSGSVSKVAGVTSGIHFPESRFLIRRMRLAKNSTLIPLLQQAGYNLEDCVGSEASTYVVSVPIKYAEGVRSHKEVSVWEKVGFAAFMQEWWSDNMVSCTASFNPETEGSQIKHVLDLYQYKLKGISFLPILKHGAYAQMPEEEITEEKYNELMLGLKPLDFSQYLIGEKADPERFCDGDKCTIGVK